MSPKEKATEIINDFEGDVFAFFLFEYQQLVKMCIKKCNFIATVLKIVRNIAV